MIRSGSFRSVGALVADIFRFLDHHNLNPKPYRWTADPKRILEKLDRAWGGPAEGNIQSRLWDITLDEPDMQIEYDEKGNEYRVLPRQQLS